jgi:hypothetical protein
VVERCGRRRLAQQVLPQCAAVVVVACGEDDRYPEALRRRLHDRPQPPVLLGPPVLGQVAAEHECVQALSVRPRAHAGDGLQGALEEGGGVDASREGVALGDEVEVGELDQGVCGAGDRHAPIVGRG